MKKGTRLKLMAGLMLLLTLILACPVSAASKKKKALNAYNAYLAQHTGTVTQFDLIYLNNDSVPELVTGKQIYTFKSGNVVKLDNSVETSYFISSYYKKKGILVQGYAHGGYYPSQFTLYSKMSGKKLVQKLEHGKFGQMNFSTGKYSFTNTYSKINGKKSKKIVKKDFNKALKGLVKSKKPTKIKLKENSVANRDKYL
ncbi:MAG: hypothetical protein IJ137_08195 [Eubacterium sp.]|nr:hypothetical protein [Eubacterium sp.]